MSLSWPLLHRGDRSAERGGLLCHGGLRLPPPLLSPLTPLRSSEAAIVWGSPPPQHQHLQTHHHHMLPSLIPLQQPRSATAALGREGLGCGGGQGGGVGGVSEGQGQRRMEEVVRRNSGHNATECKDSPLLQGAVGRRAG